MNLLNGDGKMVIDWRLQHVACLNSIRGKYKVRAYKLQGKVRGMPCSHNNRTTPDGWEIYGNGLLYNYITQITKYVVYCMQGVIKYQELEVSSHIREGTISV